MREIDPRLRGLCPRARGAELGPRSEREFDEAPDWVARVLGHGEHARRGGQGPIGWAVEQRVDLLCDDPRLALELRAFVEGACHSHLGLQHALLRVLARAVASEGDAL